MQFTAKIQHGYHKSTPGISSSKSNDEGQRERQLTGKLHRAEIEMKEKQRQRQYGSIGKADRDYNWKYHIDGGMEQHTKKALVNKSVEDMKFYGNLGNQGRLLIEDIRVNMYMVVLIIVEICIPP